MVLLSTKLIAETHDLWQRNPACYGFQVGYVGKNFTTTSQGETLTTSIFGELKKLTLSGRFAFVANPTFGYGLGLRTGFGVEYGREKIVQDDYVSKGIVIDFLLPLQLSFTIQSAKDLYVGIYTGPSFDFGLSKKLNNSKNQYYSYDMEGNKDSYNGFNCLWGTGAMIQWKCIRLDVGTEWGMYNQVPGELSRDVKILGNKPIYATVSIMLGGNYIYKKVREQRNSWSEITDDLAIDDKNYRTLARAKKLQLTANDLKCDPDECYIALLFKTDCFGMGYVQIPHEDLDYSRIMIYREKYTESQLRFLSYGHKYGL